MLYVLLYERTDARDFGGLHKNLLLSLLIRLSLGPPCDRSGV